MISAENRIDAFSRLGLVIAAVLNDEKDIHTRVKVLPEHYDVLSRLVQDAHHFNGWFTETNVRVMLASIAGNLEKNKLETWLKPYAADIERKKKVYNIGVVMAGNIPLVGFHDFLSVLITGNRIIAKLSDDDNKLLPALAGILVDIEPGFKNYIEFTNKKLENFHAIIATGSNNTSRYFDYYFGKYPNIIRRNRNGVAVLAGNETLQELEKLAEDIFLYFGLGCRNVSKIFVPRSYNFKAFLEVLEKTPKINEHYKYFNNYEHNKAIYLVNGREHFDTGNLLLVEDHRFASPVSVLYYEYYDSIQELGKLLKANADKIQCIVSSDGGLDNAVPFGKSQFPGLWDYADGVDTLKFLFSLKGESKNSFLSRNK